ncbi:MAG: TlpA family protein disulfide reductase [Desulfobacterales bacterium]|nr:TlpA family protein disulfide reductase [Desulfobacterales bacterium]
MEEKNSKQSPYKSMTLFFVISISLAGFILLQGKDSFFNLSNKVRLKPGLPAPNFTFPGLEGKTVSLTDYKGKVVFLNIWATWCPPCREEMPSMERLYQKLKGEDFIILAVSIDASGAEAVTPFARNYKLSFPVLLDNKGKSQILFETTGIPESFIIDKEGVIAQIIIGPRDWDSPETIHFFRELIQMPLPEN